ncbi:MAG: ATP-binding cassette domain-containing protein [Planctomycetes bacterium]|nr:ATP-binding cassette domain-containing protein [Planctomycetota bacterium]
MTATASPSQALLGAEHLCCGRGTDVLTDVTWHVFPGEFWCVFGPNGAGKSTLIATLLGLLPARGGAVLPVARGDRGRLGYVPQQQRFDLPLPITVAEFVALGLDRRGSRAEVQAQVGAALPLLGLTELAHRRVQDLSLGQQRRVLVARALARRPQLLVLDEPLANLDEDGAERLLADLVRLRREDGLAVVLVTHEQHRARSVASHLLRLEGGRVYTERAGAVPLAAGHGSRG